MTKALLCELLNSIIEEILTQISSYITGILFKENAMPDFFKTVNNIFLGVACALMICIILYKIIQYMLDVSNGMQQITLGEIITRSVKSSIMIVIAPFILNIAVNYVVYPIGQYAFSDINTDIVKSSQDYTQSVIDFRTPDNVDTDKGIIETAKDAVVDSVTDYTEMRKNKFSFTLMFGFITVTLIAYFVKMCIFQADFIWLQILSVKAAISMCADDNNYMGVWWREMLSQVTTVVVQTLSMAGVVKIIASEFTWYNFMLLIGMSVIVLRGPAVLRHMWYGTGSGKSLMAATKVAARKVLIKA